MNKVIYISLMFLVMLPAMIVADSSTHIGNSTYNSDGSSSTHIGNSTYNSDGSSSTRIGNTTYYND